MSKMSEVYRLYLEERRYEPSLTEEEWLKRVAKRKTNKKANGKVQERR